MQGTLHWERSAFEIYFYDAAIKINSWLCDSSMTPRVSHPSEHGISGFLNGSEHLAYTWVLITISGVELYANLIRVKSSAVR